MQVEIRFISSIDGEGAVGAVLAVAKNINGRLVYEVGEARRVS